MPPTTRKIYLIGSLRNPQVPVIAQQLRADGHQVFDDWYAAGPEGDDKWRDYEKGRGHSFVEALKGHAARHVYEFDRKHLEGADTVILVCPAGKSGHLELGWALGKGKQGFVLVDSPERWDVMYQFADGVFDNLLTLRHLLQPLMWFDSAKRWAKLLDSSTGRRDNERQRTTDW